MLDRRQCLSALLASSLPSVALAAKAPPPAAMLLPLSGSNAALGRSMARAAVLAQGSDAKGLIVLDAGGDAAAVAVAVLKRGAGLLIGPLRAAEVRPVVAAVAGRVPVITFSNDQAVAGSGALQLGLTADQVVAPLLIHARRRGVRRVMLQGGGGTWSAQVAEAARRAAPAADIAIVTSDGDALLAADPAARAEGMQLLIAPDGLNLAPATIAAWEGAWAATPDPAPFAEFAAAYEAANGATPGLIAGLAYDAARIALAVRAGGASDRSALLARPFSGVCGDIRFRADGSAQRAMAIVAIEQGRYRVVERGGLG